MDRILDSLSVFGETIVWNNTLDRNCLVYGRYQAINGTDAPVIYTQDDDAVLDDPLAIIAAYEPDKLIANMPQAFRHSFYQEHALVGFGACFDRDLPEAAFTRFYSHASGPEAWPDDDGFFLRTADIVFSALTPRVLVDVVYEELPWARADNRMWKQPTHQEERAEMLNLALQVRDSA